MIDWTIDDVEYSLLSPANLLSPGKLRKAGIDYDYKVIEACRCVGIVFSKEEMENFHYEACHLAKLTEIVNRNSPLPLTQIGEEIYLDLIEVKPLSITSKRYALHFLDKYSSYHWLVLLLNHYYEVVRDAIKNFHDVFNNMTGLNVKTWVYDNAPEFKKVLSDLYFANTRVNYTIANTPSMNGSIERDTKEHDILFNELDLWIQRSTTIGTSDSPEKSLEISAMTPASSNAGNNALDAAIEGLDLITPPPDEIMLRSTSQSPSEDNTLSSVRSYNKKAVLPQGYSIPKTFKQAKDNPHWPE
ncbi:hypothetical protein CKAH01_10356 [Colletotrichum kahawae]|uniref:Integrase catalytic domain-containing protein n=1 Tax=Colletotrichum kahawae TaxID=34407 RepID=A0AAD9XZ74_COLKA|nr:hypothetical protein CKAH01_10356 [Colletotrichum kahawae]